MPSCRPAIGRRCIWTMGHGLAIPQGPRRLCSSDQCATFGDGPRWSRVSKEATYRAVDWARLPNLWPAAGRGSEGTAREVRHPETARAIRWLLRAVQSALVGCLVPATEHVQRMCGSIAAQHERMTALSRFGLDRRRRTALVAVSPKGGRVREVATRMRLIGPALAGRGCRVVGLGPLEAMICGAVILIRGVRQSD